MTLWGSLLCKEKLLLFIQMGELSLREVTQLAQKHSMEKLEPETKACNFKSIILLMLLFVKSQ